MPFKIPGYCQILGLKNMTKNFCFFFGGYLNIMGTTLLDVKELDQEWLELIIEARNIGIPFDEIRDFLKQSS
jgi:hypothetical protein